jgi:hypothetical protein
MPPKKIKDKKPKRKVKIIRKVVIKEVQQPKQVFEYKATSTGLPIQQQQQQGTTKVFKEIGDYTSEIAKRNETSKKLTDLLERGTGLGLTLLEQALLSPDELRAKNKERARENRRETLSAEEFKRFEEHMSAPVKAGVIRRPFITKETEAEMDAYFNQSPAVAKSDGGLGEKIDLQLPINQMTNPNDDNPFDNNLSQINASSTSGLGEPLPKMKID